MIVQLTKLVIEIQLAQYVFQIINLHLGGVRLVTHVAACLLASLGLTFIKCYPELSRTLEDVKKFTKRQIQQHGDDRGGVCNRNKSEAVPAQPARADRQTQPGDRHHEQQQNRQHVIAELLE